MEERRGPEYIPARLVAEKRQHTRRRLRWLSPPLLGIGLAAAFYSYWAPRQTLQTQVERMIDAIRTNQEFHAVEYRGQPRDREYALREDFVSGARRKFVLFNGEVAMFIPTSGPVTVFERGPFTVRHHIGSLLSNPAPLRLLSECIDQAASFSMGSEGLLVLNIRNRRTLITLDRLGRPERWTTYFRTDRGEEVLSRVNVEWGKVEEAQLNPDLTVESAEEVPLTPDSAPYQMDAKTIGTAGPCDFVTLATTSNGDLVLIHRSKVESLFFEVTDDRGTSYEPAAFYATRITARKEYTAETLCLRPATSKVSWPLNLTINVRNFDPRFQVDGMQNKVLGSYKASFSKPTYAFAPPYWFPQHATDRPYFDYLRNRAYRRALAVLDRVRSEKRSGKKDLAALEKVQADALYGGAISDLREVIRLRAEYEGGGTMPMARLYVNLAELQAAAGLTGDAMRAIEYALELTRTGRSDPAVAAEAEQVAKDLGL